MKFWDIISLLILPILASPVILLFLDNQEPANKVLYIGVILGTLICEILIKVSRRIFPKSGIFLRPPDAMNCSLFNKGGSYANRIGMPSGHVALTTFVITSLLYLNHRRISIPLIIIGFLVIVLMGLSRYYRRCHTAYQVIAGAGLGILLFGLYKLILDKYRLLKNNGNFIS